MSEKENLDISRVVSLIMQKPELIEQISSLAKQEAGDVGITEEEKAPEPRAEAVSMVQDTYPINDRARGDRARLLGALKPYVSSERAKAIDSMISIADILDMMRSR